jgi:hypothetical protein
LANAQRFDRQGYLRDQQAGKSPVKENYWKGIPGDSLYVSAEKVTTLNIRYSPGIRNKDVEDVVGGELGSGVIAEVGEPETPGE